LLPIGDYLDKTPNLKKSRESIWNSMKHSDGKIYAVGIVAPPVQFVNMYRKDWLDKLKLKVPSTLDEYYQVADAISNKDPDGNGKKDTYAFGSIGQLGRYFDNVFGAYGFLPNYWSLRSGKLVQGAIQPEMKDALAFLNKMYKNGMIDPEFITDNQDRNKNKMISGVYGAMSNFVWIFDSNNSNNYYQPFKDKNPNGEWVNGPILKGPGSLSPVGGRQLSQRGWLKTSILKDSKNIDASLRLLDWLASDEGVMFMNYGIKDTHYQDLGKGLVKPLITTQQGKDYGLLSLRLADQALSKHASAQFLQVLDQAQKTAAPNPTDGLIVPETGKYNKDLTKFTDGEYFKMIIGEVPIDGGFEKFVDEWKKRGGQQLTDALNKEYANRQKK
jgi:ABC-type glycerol-3-phosphate transport system substrate-binding protein